MGQYLVRRLLLMIPSLIGVSILIFFAIRLVPGDVVMVQLADNPYIDNSQLNAIRTELGLDKPAYVQYVRWLGQVVQGNLGTSMLTGRPTVEQLAERIPVTIELALMATTLSLLIAVPLGVISAVFQSSWLDYTARLLGIIGLSAPSFWIGTLMIVLPSIWFRWTPPLTYISFFDNPGRNLNLFFFPAIALGIVMAATVMRMTRSSLLEVLRQDYVRVAEAKGLARRVVVWRHALKNALIPVVTISGLQFGFLLGGTIVIERLFALPGVGTLTLDAITKRDYAQLQTNVLFLSTIFLLVNLLVDVLYAWIDPRIRYS